MEECSGAYHVLAVTPRAGCHSPSQAEHAMQSGVIAEKNTAFVLLTRPSVLSEDAFTRARDFVPER